MTAKGQKTYKIIRDCLGIPVAEHWLGARKESCWGPITGWGMSSTCDLGISQVWTSLDAAMATLGPDWIRDDVPGNLYGDYKLTHIPTAAYRDKLLRQQAARWANATFCFVRYGHLPRGGRSRNHANGELELGVSVFEGQRARDGRLRALPRTNQQIGSYLFLQSRPLYRVEGEYIGEGSDGEPLLRQARYVKG